MPAELSHVSPYEPLVVAEGGEGYLKLVKLHHLVIPTGWVVAERDVEPEASTSPAAFGGELGGSVFLG